MAAACQSALDCQLNGACVAGACVCDRGWQGADCGNMSLAAPTVAFGYGTSNSSSWGGGPPVWDAVSGQYHLYVTEVAGGCGMSTWSFMSTAVHTVAQRVTGPYRRVGLAIPVQTHNTLYVYSPVDKLHLIYHIGAAANPPSCNPLYPNCTGGRTAGTQGLRPPAGWPHDTCHTAGGAHVHYSTSLEGPWLNGGALDIDTSGMPPTAGSSNPAPYIFPNGTVLMIGRGRDAVEGQIKHNIFLYRAPAWNATYSWVRGTGVDGAINVGNGKVMTEDPVLWRGRRGFHILFHSHPNLTHAWSLDGLTWHWSGNVMGPVVVGGGDHERPRVVVDANGDVAVLFISQEVGPDDAARTLAFPVADT